MAKVTIGRPYNGWDANVRQVRGERFYTMVRRGAILAPRKCELCGSTKGMSYHAEEYGSTWDDYIASCHPLCCYCHATIHVRHRYPNRWKRFVQRTLEGQTPEFPYTSMSAVFGAYRGVTDLPPEETPDIDLSAVDHWLGKLLVSEYDGPPKLALATDGLVLTPDFSIYGTDIESLSGVRYCAKTLQLIPFTWSANETSD